MRRLLTIITVFSMVLAFGATASAKVELSGSLSLETTWGYENAEARDGDSLTSLYRFGAGESNIGISYTSDDKKFEGYAEVCFYGRSDGNTVETGAAYMAYNGEGFSLMLGYDAHTSDDFGPGQSLDDGTALEGYGNSVLDSNEQIRLTYGEKYKLLIAIDDPYKESVWEGGGAYHRLPGLTGALELNFGNVAIHPWAHVEYLSWDGGEDSDSYYSLDLGLEINGDFGLVGFTAGINYGLNTAQNDPVVSGDPLLINNQVDSNVRQLGLWAELRVGGLALGGGYATSSRDDWSESPYTMAAYANYSIEFGMITFTPEIVWFNHGEDESGTDMGQTLLFGLWTQMEF